MSYVQNRHPSAPETAAGPWGSTMAAWLVAALTAIPSALLFTGYVKDDSYIAFRYARNLVEGFGMVFNPGERIEGYTDFLWVLFSAAFHPFDPGDGSLVLPACRVAGVAAAVALAASAVFIARRMGAAGSVTGESAALAAGALVGTHPAVAVWSMSGLEPVVFAALAAWAVERSLSGRAAASLWIGAVAVLLRPEGHVVMAFCGMYLLFRDVGGTTDKRFRDRFRGIVIAGAVPVMTVLSYHAWRYWWFGTLVGNTYRIKSCGGRALYEGFEAVLSAVSQGVGPAVVLLAAAAVILIRRRDIGATVLFALFFFAYLWWVGGDEMRYGRLVLTAWPLLAGASAVFVSAVAGRFAASDRAKPVAAALIAAVGFAAVSAGFASSLALRPELSAYRTRMESSQRVLGLYLDDNLPDWSMVAYQDMGMCPYFAPNIRFLDIIGLVSGEVADLRDEYGVRMRCVESADRKSASDARERFRSGLRDLVFSKRPEAVVLQAEIPAEQAASVIRRADSISGEEILKYCTGSYSAGLAADPRLSGGYALVHVIPRPPSMLFAVFFRNDLADTIPAPAKP